MNLKRYIICSPIEYTHTSGGIVVLFELAKRLIRFGETALVYTPKTNNTIEIPQIEGNWLEDPQCQTSIHTTDIIVYPEVIEGNPLQAKNVVRWLLHSPQFFGTKWNPSPDDIIFHYSPRGLLDSNRLPIPHLKSEAILHVTAPNLETFVNRKKLRWRLSCMIRKGHKYGTRKILPKLGLPVIDHLGQSSPEKLAQHFNESLLFISYDSETFHSVQAALCGALSIIVPNRTLNRKQHYSQTNFKYGIAYGILGIPWAILTKHKLPQYMKHLTEIENNTVKTFISITDSKFAQAITTTASPADNK